MPQQNAARRTGDDPITLCLDGEISAPIMLARLALAGLSDAAIEQALTARPGAEHLLAFFRTHADALQQVRATAAQVDHTVAASPSEVAAQFDAAVSRGPEVSVAAYSLGNPELLAAATTEVVDWLTQQRLFAPGMDVLDLGCGIGRIDAALAPQAASVLGLDVSPRMVAEAQRRHAGLPHARFAVTPGTGLADLPDSAFDLVLLADSFPYLLQAGHRIARQHVADIARILRPGGCCVVLNLSYGGDPHGDAERMSEWAAAHGLRCELADTCPFRLWDARAFVYARPHRIVRGEAPSGPPRFDITQQQSEDSR